MKKCLYICDANKPQKGNIHTETHSAYPLVSIGYPLGLFAKHNKGVRSLFVHTKR